VAATEFALILPVMLTLFLGGVEVTQLISIDTKTALATRTAADITAQLSGACKASVTSSPSNISAILKAADTVAAPYPVTPLKVVVSCLEVDKDGKAKVLWSYSARGTARARNSTFTAPAGLNDTSVATYWVLGEATYTYTPTIGYLLTGSFDLSERVYMRKRV
jgi:Flp pilus assembly protein TadG